MRCIPPLPLPSENSQTISIPQTYDTLQKVLQESEQEFKSAAMPLLHPVGKLYRYPNIIIKIYITLDNTV